jgi:hypothetical protein
MRVAKFERLARLGESGRQARGFETWRKASADAGRSNSPLESGKIGSSFFGTRLTYAAHPLSLHASSSATHPERTGTP